MIVQNVKGITKKEEPLLNIFVAENRANLFLQNMGIRATNILVKLKIFKNINTFEIFIVLYYCCKQIDLFVGIQHYTRINI